MVSAMSKKIVSPLIAFLRDMGYTEKKTDELPLQLLAQNLSKHFGKDTVMRGLRLLVESGETPPLSLQTAYAVKATGPVVLIKTIIGIIGKPGSGKETVFKLIAEKFSGNVHHAVFSTPLTAFLLDMGYPKEKIDRPTLQRVAQNLNKHFGEGTVTRGLLLLIERSDAPIVVADGVRWESDFKGLKSLENLSTKCVMIYVTASPEKRFERLKARRQRAGEKDLMWKMFLEQDNAVNERLIPELGKQAGVHHIDNNGTEEDLRKQVHDFCEQHIRA